MGKNYEEYIAELETELSDAKRECDRLREDNAFYRERRGQLVIERDLAREMLNQQDAITAWSMGFE